LARSPPRLATPPGAEAGFARYRCRAGDLERIFARNGAYGDIAAELMPMVALLSRRPAGAFGDLAELKRQACGAALAPSKAAIRAVRDLFVEAANLRLQQLYRSYLAAHPLPQPVAHGERVAALDNVREDAEAVVAGFDWEWLARWLGLDRIGQTAAHCLARLSNLAFEVNRVNFRFTYHCNVACRHCYNSSGPHAKAQRIALAAMLGIIAQMAEAGIDALNLTGGEPFLYVDDVVALIAAGRAAGLNEISIYSNGFWGSTPDKATRMLQRLAAAGFMRGARDHLKLSSGIYHQEFIALERLMSIGRCFFDMFGRRLLVDFELPPGTREPRHEIRQFFDAHDRYITVLYRAVLPLGRAQALPGSALHRIDAPCRRIDQLSFDPDGSVRPCCGLNSENLGVKIGELRRHGLRDLVKRMQNDPILQFLARQPMSTIFEHVPTKPRVAGYAGLCDLCQHAIGDLSEREQLQTALTERQEFYPFWFAPPPAAASHGVIDCEELILQSELD
jgi:hypothetical protein